MFAEKNVPEDVRELAKQVIGDGWVGWINCQNGMLSTNPDSRGGQSFLSPWEAISRGQTKQVIAALNEIAKRGAA